MASFEGCFTCWGSTALYGCSWSDVGVKKPVFLSIPGSSEVLWRRFPLRMSIITSRHVTKLMRHMHQLYDDETDLGQISDCCLPGQSKLHDIVFHRIISVIFLSKY